MEKIKKASCGVLKACAFALLSLVVYSLLVLFFNGCAKEIAVEKPVPYLVPQECALSLPARPNQSGEIVTDIKNIAQYAEQTEATALNCGARQ
jgi:hypothetical protein